MLLITEHPVRLGPGVSGTAQGGPAGSPSPPAPGSAPAVPAPPAPHSPGWVEGCRHLAATREKQERVKAPGASWDPGPVSPCSTGQGQEPGRWWEVSPVPEHPSGLVTPWGISVNIEFMATCLDVARGLWTLQWALGHSTVSWIWHRTWCGG